jgi:predicted negative regulator of RcsB-dependent stress response
VAADRTEEEQVEALKNWFGENGVSLIFGIVVALGAVFGYRAWDNDVRQTGEAASAVYENLLTAVGEVPPEGLSDEMIATGNALAGELKADYTDSSYASFAALHLAKIAIDGGNLETAVTELRWVLDNGAEDSMEILGRIRLARVLAAQEKYDEALATLDVKLELSMHLSSWEEARGDIYYGKGDMDKAREAYQLAVSNVGEETLKPYLNMKLEDLTYTASSIAANEASGDTSEEATAASEGEQE